MSLGCEWHHAWKQGAGNFGDLGKKAVSWELSLSEASWDLKLGEASPVVVYTIHHTFVGTGSSAGELTVGDVGTVSIVKIVSLSPRAEELKVKKS